MGGGGTVEDLFHNHGYRRHPFAERRIPFYNSSFPGHWSGDRSTYYDNSMYGGNSGPMFIMEDPWKGDTSFVRKRKLDGLKREAISSGGYCVPSNVVENSFKSSASSSSSEPMRSSAVSSVEETPPTRLPEPPQVSSTEPKHFSAYSVDERSSHPRVVSVPVIFTNEVKENSVKCTVIPRQGAKKLRKAMSAEGAAVLIQSWFRGYQVRKTKPLTQLRRIAKVKSQLAQLDQKASDADFIVYARENSAARIKLTEGIMNLLLQLDTIQGTHPLVREIRKVTTKEVISLQERVDITFSNDKPSQASAEIEEEGRDLEDREILPATESQANDSVASAFVNIEEEEDPSSRTVGEQANILHMSHIGAENDKANDDLRAQITGPDPDQGNGEVDVAEVSLNSMELELSEADVDEVKKTNDTMSTHLGQPDPDQGNGEVGAAEGSPELIEVEPFTPEIEGVKKSVACEMDGVEFEADQSSEAHTEQDSTLENEPSSHLRDDNGTELDGEIGFALVTDAAEAATSDTDTMRMNTSIERVVQSRDIIEDSPQGSLQGNEQVGREDFDNRIHKNLLSTTSDLSAPGGDEIIHPSSAKHDHSPTDSSSPYSPRSPFEAVDCLDFDLSNSDSELQSELQASGDIVQSTSAKGRDDDRALLLKLSKENKALKSLLVTVMKWNQMQASAMQDVNQRLGELENRMSPRISKKKSNGRRRVGKSRRLML